MSEWKNGYRNFDSIYEMNEEIILTMNKYIKYNDVLYFLGDFCFGDHRRTPEWRNRINCQTIHLIRGNHDGHIDKYKDSFSSIQDVLSIKEEHTFFLSHYSHRIWLGSHKGYIHLYGHSHNSIPEYGKSMDVGIDVAKAKFGEYRPFSREEIIEIMNKKDVAFVDGHNSLTNVK